MGEDCGSHTVQCQEAGALRNICLLGFFSVDIKLLLSSRNKKDPPVRKPRLSM